MDTHLIHVLCTDTGTWLVQADDRDEPFSRHVSETAAERAALAMARRRGGDVLVHDRYRRVHRATDNQGEL
jgi:hypothetical protein